MRHQITSALAMILLTLSLSAGFRPKPTHVELRTF